MYFYLNINLIKNLDGKVYEGVPNEWMPDIIPTETYVHHTLQRSFQLPQILSPCPPPLKHPVNIIENMSDNEIQNNISNRYLNNFQEASLISASTATLTRYSTNSINNQLNSQKGNSTLNRYNTNTLRFGTTIDDEMNDAYYTYTARKVKASPATTFN